MIEQYRSKPDADLWLSWHERPNPAPMGIVEAEGARLGARLVEVCDPVFLAALVAQIADDRAPVKHPKRPTCRAHGVAFCRECGL